MTEKIHGAHFCIVTDGSTLVGASRKHLLAPGEHFFEYQRVLRRMEQHIYQLFHQTSRLYPQLAWLSIYGELFGGMYPHPDVSPVTGLQPIQTGIYYTPDIEFCVFDLAISDSQFSASYLDYDQAHTLLQSVGILSSPPLLIGSYQEALQYPIQFSSTIPALFGLPPLPIENNAEGVVIKPINALTLPTPKGPIRPILKRKIAAFAEDRRFHQAQKWVHPSSPPGSGTLDLLKWEVFHQVTENRLRSAISKIGYRGLRKPSRSRQLFHMFVTDVQEQLALAQPDLLTDLTKSEQQELLASIQKEIRMLLKQFFQKEHQRV